MATNNASNENQQGTQYYNGTGTFSGIDASTSGFVLTSNGTGTAPSFQSAGGAVGNLLTTTTSLTSAEIKNLFSTPIQLIAAPGVGNMILLLYITAKFNYGGSNAFTNGQAIFCYYGSRTSGTNVQIITSSLVTGTTSVYTYTGVGDNNGNSVTSLDDLAITASNTTGNITGNAAGDNTIDVTTYYYIVPTPT